MKLKLAGAALLLLSSTMLVDGAHADVPGKHPAYLHALPNLRAARWLIEHRPAEFSAGAHESAAIEQIDLALHDVQEASIWDGKDVHDHPPVDEHGEWGSRLHHAIDRLEEARGDCNREEDDPATRGLKHRALEHIDAALREARAALADVEHHH